MEYKLGFLFMMGLMALSPSVSRADDYNPVIMRDNIEGAAVAAGLGIAGVGGITAVSMGDRGQLLNLQLEKNKRVLAKTPDAVLKRELKSENEELKRKILKNGKSIYSTLFGSAAVGSLLIIYNGEIGEQVSKRIEKARADSQSQSNTGRSPASPGTANVSAQ